METLFTDYLEDDESPSSRRASRANPSQLREAARLLVTTVISGQKSPESFAKLCLDGSWVKTSEGYSLFAEEASSVPFSQTWPTWGTALDGDATELTKPVDLAIEGTEFSSLPTWPTPRAAESKGVAYQRDQGTKGLERLSLTGLAQAWHTPRAMDGRAKGAAGGKMESIGTQVARWESPTWIAPHGMTGTDKTGKAGAGGEFAEQATKWMEHWPTPRTPSGGPESAERKVELGRKNSGGGDLQSAAEMWSTPRSEKTTSENPETWQARADAGHVSTPPLPMQAEMWRTPDTGAGGTSQQLKDGNKVRESVALITLRLADQVEMWGTPTSNDSKNSLTQSQADRSTLTSDALKWSTESPDPLTTTDGENCLKSDTTLLPHSPKRKRLNWRFVQHLMGFPDGWL